MKKKILVVDDEFHIIELVRFNLESNGYDVIEAMTGKEALNKIKVEHPDLILLDLMLPEVDGIEICRKVRGDIETEDIPIIMLTAKGEETDKIVGLEMGADDYITKPFSVRELIARVKAVLRRNREKVEEKSTEPIVIGDITIYGDRYEVFKGEQKIELTLKEFELLNLLAKNRGKVLSRNFLLDEIWGYDYFGETRTVDVHIRHIRKKLESSDKQVKLIETIRGIGYKLN